MSDYKVSLEAKRGEVQAAMDAVLKVLEEKKVEVDTRKTALDNRMEETGLGPTVYTPPNIVVLNVGGVRCRVTRKALTFVKDTRLSYMFSGRWDHMLLRDKDGLIFLDIDANWFSPIINFLSELCTSEDASTVPTPTVEGDDLVGYNLCVDFFGLRSAMPILDRFDAQIRTMRVLAAKNTTLPKSIRWELPWSVLYQGTVDGFSEQTFRSRCSGKANTVVLAVDKAGDIFAAFSSDGWGSVEAWKNEPYALLFWLAVGGKSVKEYCRPNASTTSRSGRVYSYVENFPIISSASSSSRVTEFRVQLSGTEASYRNAQTKELVRLSEVVAWQIPTGEPLPGFAPDEPPPCRYNPSEGMSFSERVKKLNEPAHTLGPALQGWLKDQVDELMETLDALIAAAESLELEIAFMFSEAEAAGIDLAARKKEWLENGSRSSPYLCR